MCVFIIFVRDIIGVCGRCINTWKLYYRKKTVGLNSGGEQIQLHGCSFGVRYYRGSGCGVRNPQETTNILSKENTFVFVLKRIILSFLNKITKQIWFLHYHWAYLYFLKKKNETPNFCCWFFNRGIPRLPQWKLRHCKYPFPSIRLRLK